MAAGSVVFAVLFLSACSSSSGSTEAVDTSVTTSAASTEVPAIVSTVAGSTANGPVVAPPVSVETGPSLGCLTNGTMSGPFKEKVVDAITRVNTQNAGENAPDAYYATSWGKNTIGYFVFGSKATVVVNGDGSWSGESGSDVGQIDIASDGTKAVVNVTIEGSDAMGQRAKPLTLDLVTRCGVELPTTIAPVPVNTKQNVTVSIVEEPAGSTASTTPS